MGGCSTDGEERERGEGLRDRERPNALAKDKTSDGSRAARREKMIEEKKVETSQ